MEKTLSAETNTNIPKRWQRPVRLGWGLLALLVLVVFFGSIPARLAELQGDPYHFAGAYERLGITIEFFALYFTGIEAIYASLFVVVGGLIFWKASDDWMAIIVSMTFLVMAVSTPLGNALETINPIWRWPVLLLFVLTFNLGILMFLLFPSGRFVPRWTRWLALALALYTAAWFFFPSLVPSVAILVQATTIQELRSYMAIATVVIIGVGTQLYRYRNVSNRVQRQQTKWVVLGFAMFLAGLTLILVPYVVSPALRESDTASLRFVILFGPALLLAGTLIPLSFALAILRYRLWDISIVVRKTLIYGLISAMLILVYFATVVLLQTLITAVSDQQSPVAIVISTLVIAALFNPLRHWVQHFIDRRFYRRRYDAAQTLDAFAQTTRDEVDLDRLTTELVRVVEATMQPVSVSLWLRDENRNLRGSGRDAER